MNNTVAKMIFWISQGKWLQYIGEVGLCIRCCFQIFSGLAHQKSLKSVNF